MLLQIRWLRDRFQIPEPSAAAVQDIGTWRFSVIIRAGPAQADSVDRK